MNANSSSIRAVGLVVAAAALIGNVGCAKMSWQPSKMFSLDNSWPFRDKDAPQEGIPTRMAGTWTDTVLSQPGKKSQRGFGGRIMFYEKDEAKPILVDGQLVVYAFDENGREVTDNKPTRRYVFPADQLPLHMSKNELGASYSFFLPWDEAGGPRTEVSLICRFEPNGGPVVSSEQTRHMLPGSTLVASGDGAKQPPKLPDGVPAKPVVPTLQSLQAKRIEEQQAQLVSYEATAPADPQAAAAGTATGASTLPPKHLTATTINLPNSFQMPSAAAVANQAVLAAGTAQAATPPYAPSFANQPTLQQTPAVNQPPTTQPAVAPPVPLSRSCPGLPATSPAAVTMPATTALAQSAGTFSTTPATQAPLTQLQAQQAAQQAALQQQLLQQQMLQQQALQQRMLQSQIPGQVPAR